MIKEKIQIGTSVLLDLFFPPRCVGCGKVDLRICSDCQKSIVRVRPPFCPKCGRMVDAPLDASPAECFAACTVCVHHPSLLESIQPAVEYPGVIRQAIHALKYHGRRDMAAILADFLVLAWHDNPFPVDVVVPVPLHTGRQRERGYNQSILIAELFARQIGLPFCPDALIRWRKTESQTMLSSFERRVNVAGAFKKNEYVDLRGKNVLLLDDVSTTGSTLQACAAALRDEHVDKVFAMTVARAEWNPVSGKMADSFL